MDHNRWHGVGRLTRDPEYVPPGRKGPGHCTFSLATNRVVPNEDGPMADYIPCSIWGEEADRLVGRVRKGDEIAIRGRIRTNFVAQADGDRRFFWEVRVDHVAYGRIALKNLRESPAVDDATRAVGILNQEFGE